MDKINHLFILPDGDRRYARRDYLKDLLKQSKEKFRSALKRLLKKDILALEKRIKIYAQTGKDPFYKKESKDLDILDSNEIQVPKDYLLNSYRKSGKFFASLIKWILKNKITKVLTIYALQKKNLDRSDEETYAILKSEAEYFKIFTNDKQIVSQCKFKFVGNFELFEIHKNRAYLREMIKEYINNAKELEKKSLGKKLKIYVLTPYDRNWEINQAIVNNRFDPTKLIVKEEVDLIVRGGNTKTPISGGLPYQIAYAQFISAREYFPDFTIKTIQKILKSYRAKKRESGL